MKVLSVVGARPQFVKLSPVDTALREAGMEHRIVHTGQHYDPSLSNQLFEDLAIPEADINLGVGSGSHALQTASMMTSLETIFLEEKPDWVLVYGDTNSTLAASLAAVKIHQKFAHLEAGLRSGNRLMPEEHNRVVTDHTADFLLAPTKTAMEHLKKEGLMNRSELVGDVMTDVCWSTRDRNRTKRPRMPDSIFDTEQYILSTIHRAENTDSPERLAAIVTHLANLEIPVALVAHPRLIAKTNDYGISLEQGSIRVVESLSYSQMVAAVSTAKGTITDSGGLQKEAFLLSSPCITLRTETEWPETLVGNWNVLDPNLTLNPLAHFELKSRKPDTTFPFGEGDASQKVVAALLRNLN